MKIKKFNEIYGYKPTDKLLKVTISGEFVVPLEEIIATERYKEAIEEWNVPRDQAIHYGLEEYISDGNHNSIQYDLIDGNGDIIEDEELFDDKNKYNL